jgi:hypothetical protein
MGRVAVMVNSGQAVIAAASFWGVSTWAAGIVPFDTSHGPRYTSPTVVNITPSRSLRRPADRR